MKLGSENIFKTVLSKQMAERDAVVLNINTLKSVDYRENLINELDNEIKKLAVIEMSIATTTNFLAQILGVPEAPPKPEVPQKKEK